MSRLEEIKRAYNYPYNNEVGYPYWLISRVDELEADRDVLEKKYDEQLEESHKTYDYFKNEINRYKQALENSLYFVKYSRYEPDKARIMQEEIEKALKGESE